MIAHVAVGLASLRNSRILARLVVLVSLAATLIVLVKFGFVHRCYSLDLFESHRAFTKGAARINRQPLLNTSSVEVVSYIARKRGHLGVFVEIYQTNETRLLALKNVSIVLNTEQLVKHILGPIESSAFVLTVLILNVENVGCT